MNDILNEFDIFYRTRLDYWKKQNLSYSWYWFLAVFFGWLGLDQFYLGSPIAGVMKIVLNIIMLGWPWFYDAMNATMNQDHVKFTGPINPVVGPLGIGAGRFSPDPSTVPASHKNMLIYGLVVIMLGLFGADSFLVGDKLSGYLRIILLFTFFFAPVAIIWWLYKLYLYFIRTDQLLDQNYVYFDAPKPSDSRAISRIDTAS
jgi:TM2 domain-containing membrane protein YozV